MAYQNFYTTKLYTDVGAADTTITLETPPTVTSGRLVLEARNVSKREVIKYTGVSGNQVTGVLRGQGGTTAQTHLANTLVEMNLTAEDLEDAINVPNDIVTRFDESLGDFIASGLVWSQTALLVGEMTAGVVYIDGERLVIGALSGINFTASRDTYVDVGVDGVVDYSAVANAASAPALAGSHVRIAKVVTNGSGITSVVQTGVDSLGNTISPSGSVTPIKQSNPCKFLAYVNTSVSVGNNAIIPYANEVFDTNNNFSTSTYKYTIPVSGFYYIGATAYLVSETHQPWIGLYKNGSRMADGMILPTVGGANCAVNVQGIYQFTAGDTIEVRRFNSAANAKNVYGTLAGLETMFNGFLVSGT